MKVQAFLAIIALFGLSAGVAPSQPDISFRLNTIERRIDQMQIRVDAMERELRTQALLQSPERSTGVDDLRQQYVGLSEQVSLMQLQLIEVRKTLDRLVEPPKDEKKKKP
jgi:hypothetical protein